MKEIKYNNLDEIIYYDKCNNGLDVYMLVNPRVNNYYITLNVLYGSVHTSFKVKGKEYNVPNGIAHFLEHITFNEKDGKTAYDYYSKMGSSINAFTTFDFTSYEVYGSENIIDNVTHLIDYVETPVINKKLIDKERDIINEEIDMGLNNPGKRLFFATNKILFHKNKQMNEITGTHEDLKKINEDNLKLVYNNFYHPSNMFLVITGNFNPYELMAAIKENQDSKKFKEYNKPKIIKEKEDVTVVKQEETIVGNVELPKVVVNYKMSRKDFKNIKDDVTLLISLRILMNANFGSTSDFKEDLMEKELITGINNNVKKVDDIIIISISCETRFPNEIINMIKNNMNKLLITKDVLNRRVKSNISCLITDFDDIENVNSNIYGNIISYGKVINNIYNIYKNINLEDINYIIKHLNLNNCAVITQMGR